jgi:hypothetical protein
MVNSSLSHTRTYIYIYSSARSFLVNPYIQIYTWLLFLWLGLSRNQAYGKDVFATEDWIDVGRGAGR